MAPRPVRRTSSTTPEPINMFEFSRPVLEAAAGRGRSSGSPVRWCTSWSASGSACTSNSGLPQPPLEPTAVERLYLDNYFSTAKAKRDLGYEPLFTTAQAMDECLPYYVRAVPAPWSRRTSPRRCPAPTRCPGFDALTFLASVRVGPRLAGPCGKSCTLAERDRRTELTLRPLTVSGQ